MTPPILARRRLLAFFGLMVLGLVEAGMLAGAALTTRWTVESGALAAFTAAGAFAIGSVATAWLRAVAAEDLGMRYANEVRSALARHAIIAGGAGRRRRLGALAVRLTGDLNALREWASPGVSDLVAALAMLGAGVAVLYISLATPGLIVAAAAAAPTLVGILLLLPALWFAHVRLRRERGRVSALAGDLVIAAPTLARYDAGAGEERRLQARGEDLREAAVNRRRAAAGMASPALAATGAGALCAAWIGAAESPADWAAILFGVGFLATGIAGLGRSVDVFLAFLVAHARMRELDKQMKEDDAAAAAAQVGGRKPIARRGEILTVAGASAAEACAEVEAMAKRAGAKDARPRDLARWYPLVAPSLPLVRASLRRNLTLRRRDASDDDLRAALTAVGLDPQAWSLDLRIDPALGDPDEWIQARLRLARAIAHRPRVVFLAEPTLLVLPEYQQLVEQVRALTGAGVVAASAGGERAAA